MGRNFTLFKTMKAVSVLWAIAVLNGCRSSTPQTKEASVENYPVQRTEAEWRKQLTPEQYRILREKGTEYPGSGVYNLHFEDGIYTCAGCGTELFSSEQKFDSHCGWPSFDAALSNNKVVEKRDLSHGMVRTEILCGSCGGHLGHVFPDGPTETGLRYCVNSLSLDFKPNNDTAESK